MNYRQIPVTDSQQWQQALACFPTETLSSHAYHLLFQRLWGGEPFLDVLESPDGILVWPAMRHAGLQGESWCDLSSAYGFSGPLLKLKDPAAKQKFLDAAFSELMASWRQNQVVSVFTRFSPFHRNHVDFSHWLNQNEMVQGTVLPAGHVVLCDLLETPEERRSRLRRSFRKEVAAAQRAGFRFEFDSEWTHVEAFAGTLETVGDRNQVSERYRLTPASVLEFKALLGADALLFHLWDGDALAASTLCIRSGGVMHGFFGGPHSDYVRTGAYKLLLTQLAEWGAADGLRCLNIGGGRGANDEDNLYIFKRGISDLTLPFFMGRVIVDPEKYKELTNRFYPEGLDTSYFPIYRSQPGAKAESEVKAEPFSVASDGRNS